MDFTCNGGYVFADCLWEAGRRQDKDRTDNGLFRKMKFLRSEAAAVTGQRSWYI